MHGFSLDGASMWAMPEFTGIGRLPMRTQFVAFPDRASARAGDVGASPWRRSLNGRWWFTLVDGPDRAPARFAEPDLDPSSGEWTPMVVPGTWSDVAGTTDEKSSGANPTGLYRAAVSIPGEWIGRRTVLHVGGAQGVLHVYVNGVAVGMGKDSYLPNEFDVTRLVREGANTIALAVVHSSGGDGVEARAAESDGGITGDIFCYSTAPVFLVDVGVRAGLNTAEVRSGALEVTATVGFPGHAGLGDGWRVEVDVETIEGVPLLDSTLAGDVEACVPTAQGLPTNRSTVVLRARIADVDGWSAENPARYRVLVALLHDDEDPVEVVSQVVGFRTIEVAGAQLLVNGEPVKVRGVIYDDDSLQSLGPSAEGAVRAELEMMKRFNVNAVRFFGHPTDSRVLELCDELGLYVFEDANIDFRSSQSVSVDDPRLMTAIVERGSRMVQRDKNHPSVIGWFQGVGGASEPGVTHGGSMPRSNLSAQAGWIRGGDPTRPIVNEMDALFGHGNPDETVANCSLGDLACTTAPTVDEVLDGLRRGKSTGRPVLQGRYGESRGNANGDMAGWFAAFGANHELVGGFLWKWNDLIVDVAGVTKALPALTEFKYLAAPVGVTASDHDLRRKKVRITNRQSFDTLAWLSAYWELALDGVVLAAGELDVPEVQPGETVTVEVPYDRPATVVADSTLTVTVRFRASESHAWADAGHEVAWQQFVVPMPSKAVTARPIVGPVRNFEVERDHAGGRARVAVGKLLVELDEATGEVVVLRWAGQELMASPPRISLWRAPTDHDRAVPPEGGGSPAMQWAELGLDRLHRSPVSANTAVAHDAVSVMSRHKIWGRDSGIVMTYRQKIKVLSSGDIVFDHEIGIPEGVDDLARIGMSFAVSGELEKLQWVGLGPGETYPDRCLGSTIGRWYTTATDSYVPYVNPQEHGLRVGTKWFALTRLGDTSGRYGTTGAGLFFGAIDPDPFAFSVSHHTAADLDVASSSDELVARPEVVVHVDAAHRGLGGATTGHGAVGRLGSGNWKWSWRLRAFDPLIEDPGAIGAQVLG